MYPPTLMRLRIMQNGRGVSLWLPLFLIWPLVIAVQLALLPFLLLAIIVLWPSGWGERLFAASITLICVVCALRGLAIEVDRPEQQVNIAFH